VFVDQVVNNVGVVLELTERLNVPFFKGCDHFILNKWKPSSYLGHGSDGLGDTGMMTNLKARDEFAVSALIRLTKEYDDINLIAIGPLTNVALACLIDPDFPKRVKTFCIMGGAHECKGNVGLASEFNIHCDPEAAKICLDRFPMTRMITLETSHECYVPWDLWKQITESDNNYAKFLTAISGKMLGHDAPGYMAYDLIAVLSYLAEDTNRSEQLFCDIELTGTVSRGATIFDWRNKVPPNTLLVKINLPEMLRLVTQIVLK
jgi:inosine-uridine nucleoside N-ribohydrolase